MVSLTSAEHHNPDLEDIYRASIDATYSHVCNTGIGLAEQDPRNGIHLARLQVEIGNGTPQQLFVLSTLHSSTPDELSLIQTACQSIFVSSEKPLDSPTLIVEERVRNPDILSPDETIFREEGEVAVVEKQFRGAGHERVMSFGLSSETWTTLANTYGVNRTAKYLQWRLGPQWSVIPDGDQPPIDQYFGRGLHRYPAIAGNLPDTFPADTIRSLSELGVGILDDEEVTDLRRFAKWMRRETFAPYALREREAFITPMQYFSIIVNRERDVALLHATVQELRNGRDVVIGAGALHGTVVLDTIENIQGMLGWHVNREDIILDA